MAGMNVRCTFWPPDQYILPLRELVKEGAVPMQQIDHLVRDVLRTKFRLGPVRSAVRRAGAARTRS